MACINEKCRDPCPGVCGNNAECRTLNHIAMCICLPGYIGDPFTNCHEDIPQKPYVPIRPEYPQTTRQPPLAEPQTPVYVQPTPQPPQYIQPQTYPQPTTSRPIVIEEPQRPIPVIPLQPEVVTPTRPPQFIPSIPPQHPPFHEHITPCVPNPCGSNAECRTHNNAGSCVCLPNYFGNPYEGCRPECVLNSDCPSTKACIQTKCQDPCPGTCGRNALCHVTNHLPICTCYDGYTGDPYSICHQDQPSKIFSNNDHNKVINNTLISSKSLEEPVVYVNPCIPSPCGPNSKCREINQQAVCSCLPDFIGTPPACRPECTTNSECPLDKACINRKCEDPCPGTCGLNAECRTLNHIPMCDCLPSYTGDAFTRCYRQPRKKLNFNHHVTINNYNKIFLLTLAPPPPTPTTPPTSIVVAQEEKEPINPCYPSPCGQYAQCHNRNGAAICACLPNYIGAPPNCRPECVVNSDCPAHLACINEKCRDPCPGSCGFSAVCSVVNHVPNCVCEVGFIGDPFTECHPKPVIKTTPPAVSEEDPCIPSPCGANAKCDKGSCSCLPEYHGDPYIGCRPECVLNSDCARDRACINQKCQDPCPGTCGISAECNVINHTPMCSCPSGMTGNAFIRCEPVKEPIREDTPKPPPVNPCHPSPCGPNAQCREINQQAVCSCIPGFIGSPPSCRPECTTNSDCPGDRYCLNQKCVDACAGACGISAVCRAYNHAPICSCPTRFTGNPFIKCSPIGTI